MHAESSTRQCWSISAEEQSQRIDNYLRSKLKGVPKSLIYRLLRTGAIRVNKKRVKPLYRLQAQDEVRLPPVRFSQPAPMAALHKVKALSGYLLYEDEALLVINKPSGMAVHGGSGVNIAVIEGLRALRTDLAYLELVHRLDRETSGLLLIAKKRSVLRALHQQLRDQQVKKCYWALVHGKWPIDCTRITAPLLKTVLPTGERLIQIHPQGKPAETHFTVIEQFHRATLLQVKPITGRTHQIRVHTQSVGHPIVFDARYGHRQWDAPFSAQESLGRLFLHAASLCFTHPQSGQRLILEAPLEAALERMLQQLRCAIDQNICTEATLNF
jgi:23S rRNA pseudouridine955/2504/2580 synthase